MKQFKVTFTRILTHEEVIEAALGAPVKLLTPLIDVSKATVIRLALEHGIAGTYSCHSGDKRPCGVCIACREISSARN